jgi:hypothetical protein
MKVQASEAMKNAFAVDTCFESYDDLRQRIDFYTNNEFHPLIIGDCHKLGVGDRIALDCTTNVFYVLVFAQ